MADDKKFETLIKKIMENKGEKNLYNANESCNMMDYLAWRGDISMIEKSFNPVDDLILSTLAYLDLRDILKIGNTKDTLSLNEVSKLYIELGKNQDDVSNDPGPLLKAASKTKRFGNINIGFYEDIIDSERLLQFAAMTFFLEDGTIYTAFRGTDNTLVGWKEDLTMSYLEETPGQRMAVRYLEVVGKNVDLPIRVGGHSKGGNFAIYGSAFSKKEIRDRIIYISSHDGPGLSKNSVKCTSYNEILDRTTLYMPEGSLIGILMENKAKRVIVESNGNGFMQHNPYTWVVKYENFKILKKQSSTSLIWEETIRQWLDDLSYGEKALILNALFGIVDNSGAEKVSEIGGKISNYNSILKGIVSLEGETKNNIIDGLEKLVSSGNTVLQKGTQDKIKGLLENKLDLKSE